MRTVGGVDCIVFEAIDAADVIVALEGRLAFELRTIAHHINVVSTVDASHLLFIMEHHQGSMQPGDFFTHLIKAIARADDTNLHLLSGPYPGLVSAYRLYAHFDDGRELLVSRMKGNL